MQNKKEFLSLETKKFLASSATIASSMIVATGIFNLYNKLIYAMGVYPTMKTLDGYKAGLPFLAIITMIISFVIFIKLDKK